MGRICADPICENPPHPRHPRSISSLVWAQPEQLPYAAAGMYCTLGAENVPGTLRKFPGQATICRSVPGT
ncbi:MAG TPA: hypothetical protein DCL15_02600 [Chloroflexi bacterium]|nr:hypothetical protein [Chloroflexota bacterium]